MERPAHRWHPRWRSFPEPSNASLSYVANDAIRVLGDEVDCPCGSDLRYGACCGPVHRDGAGLGATAEQLMRARYSAYVLHDGDFLLRSWHPDTRPKTLGFSDEQTWHGLTVVASSGGAVWNGRARWSSEPASSGAVTTSKLHELSSFIRFGGKWLYLDGYNPGD